MIDAKQTAKGQAKSQAHTGNGKVFRDEYVREAPSSSKAETSDFTSFQTWAESALRHGQQQNKTTALTLADPAFAFRGMTLPKAEIEKLRGEILMLHQQHGTLSLGFASAQRGEGTSTILANLALALRKNNLRVLLVDLNLVHPNLPRLFSLADAPGLSDLIEGKIGLREVVRVVKSNKVFLLPLGKPRRPAGLDLANAIWAINIAAKNAKYFDLILFDLPPLNEFPQALYAARQTDGVIQIVQAERTRVEVVRSLKAKLDQMGIQHFGVILNQRRFHIPQLIYENL